jgi:hypothetical protein
MSAQRPTSSGAAKPTDVIVEYTQTGAGVPEGGKTGTASLREGSLEARMLVPCANPECKKGGFLLRPKVDAAAQRGESELTLDLACAGYVGPLRSERGPASGCGNKLAARVRLLFGKLGPK